ncbi:MAG: GH25 family lysozyme [Eubacterium sp.]|nr:GH25 family lysozyme [Eubacterium sp.]
MHIIKKAAALAAALVLGLSLAACGREVTRESDAFMDAVKEAYATTLGSGYPAYEYTTNAFMREGNIISYTDENFTSEVGVDVSEYSGTIDWEALKAQGFQFAFIRIGYRGYGEDGTLNLDPAYTENIQNAKAAGFEVGVYFFAQAINEEEAAEEAAFVLEQLGDTELDLPIVYDPENIEGTEARTDGLTREQFTANTAAFCKAITDAGYDTAFYCNLTWQTLHLNLSQLADYPIWYADSSEKPQTPDMFEFWQYAESVTLDGIEGSFDLNIRLIPNE